MRFCRTPLFIGILMLMCAVLPASAQMTGRMSLGTVGTDTQASSGIDNVNLSNGNVSLQIPLASLPPMAGGKLSYTLNAYYNSGIWASYSQQQVGETSGGGGGCHQLYVTSSVGPGDGGWSIGGRYQIIFRDARTDFDYVQPNNSGCEPYEYYHMNGVFFRPILRLPDGSEHEMRIYGTYATYPGQNEFLGNYYKAYNYDISNPFAGTAGRMYTTDGTFIDVTYSTTGAYAIYLKDGTVITNDGNDQLITDTNGNSVRLGNDGTYEFAKDEATGRKIRWKPDTYNSQTATKVEYQSTEGSWQTVWAVWGTTEVGGILYPRQEWNILGGHFHIGGTCNTWTYAGAIFPVVRQIIYPSTETGVSPPEYSFDYKSDDWGEVTDTSVSIACGTAATRTRQASQGTGELSEITTPTGAIISYDYAHDGAHKLLAIATEGADRFVANPVTEKRVTHDGVTDTWTYELPLDSSENHADLTNPDGSTYSEDSHPTDKLRKSLAGTYGLGGLVYRTVDNKRVMTEKHWTLLGGDLYSYGSLGSGTGDKISFNPVVDTEYTTLLDTDGTTRLKMTAKTFTYDYNGDVTSVTEYGWINLSSVSYASNGVPTGIPSGTAVMRVTNNSYYNTASSSSDSTAYHKRALGSGTTVILGKLKESTVGTSSTVKSDTRFSYDSQSWGTAPTLGNLTKVSSYNDVSSSWIDTLTTYTTRGNVASTTDANGNGTQVTYGSVGGHYDLYPTSTYAAHGTSIVRRTDFAYDFYTGLTLSTFDYDNSLGSTTEYDIRLRPITQTTVTGSIGNNSPVAETTTAYHDHDRFVVVRSDLLALGDGKKVGIQHYDMLGRVRLSRTLEDASTQSATDETHGIKVETLYKINGGYTYQLTSNPFRASAATSETDATMGWTRSKAWASGRQSQAETFSGASLPAPWGSNTSTTGVVDTQIAANVTTVTDQASKVRRSITDPLGRLERVDEPTTSGLGTVTSPNQATSYTYDVLNNLLGVSQGSQTRSFAYSSLGRLTSAANPESGTIAYTYDSNGNLATKTDARTISTTYTYDALNRVTFRNYSDSTPDVTYTYDAQTSAKGKLTKVASSASTTEYTSFDTLGRITGHKQTTDGNNYTTSYTYKLDGSLYEETYPSGRVVKNTLAANGNLAQVETKPSGGSYTNRASNFVYNPAGAVQSLQLGNGKYETTQFNARLQPTQIGLGTSTTDTSLLKLQYGYGTTANNGNIQSQTITVPGLGYAFNQTYTYDELNRIASATETYDGSQTWAQAFGYDRYGNRNITSGSGATSLTFGATTNRITTTGYTYDSAGNTTADPVGTGRTLVYDAENKQTSVSVTGGATLGTYQYDGDGKRIKKDASTGDDIIFVYDAAGKLIEEYSMANPNPAISPPTTSYVYAGSRLLSTETAEKRQPVAATASNVYAAGSEASKAIDGNASTAWNAGNFPSQWIQLDLGQVVSVAKLRLLVAQYPAGQTTHEIYGGATTGNMTLLGTLNGTTSDGGWLEFSTSASVRYVRIVTTSSPSWVAWFEIEVYGPAAVNYLTADHLGSPRINTNGSGSVVSRHDYMPFGEEISTSQRTGGLSYSSDVVRKKFTGYEKDWETNLDFAEARYFNAGYGRFSSPDPYNIVFEKDKGEDEDEKGAIFIGFVSNPQRWNSYVYVMNNPLAFTDPDGREPKTINLFLGLANEDGMKEWEEFAKKAREKGFTVNIYTVDGGTATASKFLESLKAKDTVTIFAGHSQSTRAGERVGIQFNGSMIGNSQAQSQGKVSNTADGVNIQNDIVAVFSCGFGKGFNNITSSNGAAFVSIAQGSDPGTMIDSVNRAALRFAESITDNLGGVLTRNFSVARDSNLRSATSRAEAGMGEFGRVPQNSGDRVLYRYLSRSKGR